MMLPFVVLALPLSESAFCYLERCHAKLRRNRAPYATRASSSLDTEGKRAAFIEGWSPIFDSTTATDRDTTKLRSPLYKSLSVTHHTEHRRKVKSCISSAGYVRLGLCQPSFPLFSRSGFLSLQCGSLWSSNKGPCILECDMPNFIE